MESKKEHPIIDVGSNFEITRLGDADILL